MSRLYGAPVHETKARDLVKDMHAIMDALAEYPPDILCPAGGKHCANPNLCGAWGDCMRAEPEAFR